MVAYKSRAADVSESAGTAVSFRVGGHRKQSAKHQCFPKRRPNGSAVR